MLDWGYDLTDAIVYDIILNKLLNILLKFIYLLIF